MDIDEKLISLVKRHECLYNINLRTYSDKNSKQHAWDEISNEMGISIQECIIKWRRLRDNFRKALRTREKSGSAAAKRRPLKFEWELEFVKPFIKYCDDELMNSYMTVNSDNTATTEAAESFMNQEMHSEDVAQDFGDFTSAPAYHIDNIDPSVESASNHVSKPSSSRDIIPTVEDILQNYLQAKATKEKDPIDAFFLAMAASVKRLPQRLQLQVKQNVFNAVTDAELKVLNQGQGP